MGSKRYAESGVDLDAKGGALSGLLGWVRQTFENNPRAPVSMDVGYYASILDLADLPVSLAISTDGVGTKLLVAQRVGRHDTVGIDCVAMNANDLVCVGAEPLAMVDYIAVERADRELLEQLGKGLAEGARRAEISIPGGEMAQVREMIRGEGDGPAYDLVGACVGILRKDEAIDGSLVESGDVVVGIAATGLHSNGYSLARRVIFGQMGKDVDDVLPDCGRTVGEELLEPTAMYVREAKTLLRDGTQVQALLNVTGGGFLNCLRVAAPGVGFHLHSLPEPPAIFHLIAEAGQVPPAEMHEVFNMGVGFAVVVPAGQEDRVIAAAEAENKAAQVIGRVVADPARRVVVERESVPGCLVGVDGGFSQEDGLPEGYAS